MGAIAIAAAIAATFGPYAPRRYMALPGTDGKPARPTGR